MGPAGAIIDAVRLTASSNVDVSPAELFTIASDLRNLPVWWIEHLSATVTSPAQRARDAVYEVRYRLPIGLVVSATCTVVAVRAPRSITYIWDGWGIRMAVGQQFVPARSGCRTTLVADIAASSRLRPLSGLLVRVMGATLGEELQRALATLAEIASAGAIVGRAPAERGESRRGRGRQAAAAREGQLGG
jgi:uncharacterized protein YndB with AHSA1/START domain